MHPTRIAGFAFVAMLIGGRASAQEAGQIGVSMGYPGSIGMVWHVADRIAVRPDFLFRGSSTESATSEQSSTVVGVGIGASVYLSKRDALSLYVSPRFAYQRSSSRSESSILRTLSPQELASLGLAIAQLPSTSFKSTTSTKAISGSFGAQYALHKRFSVFGEAGLNYSTITLPTTDLGDFGFPASVTLTFADTPRPHTWGTVTAVGVIVYFKD